MIKYGTNPKVLVGKVEVLHEMDELVFLYKFIGDPYIMNIQNSYF